MTESDVLRASPERLERLEAEANEAREAYDTYRAEMIRGAGATSPSRLRTLQQTCRLAEARYERERRDPR